MATESHELDRAGIDGVLGPQAIAHSTGLLRSVGGFSNFAVSFTIISIITGIATLYDYGLSTAGPREMTLGWPLATIGTLLVTLSMAELCSALPTSGAMYDWASVLGGPTWAWFTAWFNIIGLIASVGGVDYGCARFLVPMLGLESKTSTLLSVYAVMLLSHALINHYGIRFVAYLNDLSVTIHILGVTVLIGSLWLFAPKQSISFLLKASSSGPVQAPYFWLFLLGLLHAEWIFCGFDASAHIAEETVDAPMRAPWGMVTSVVVSAFFGYILILSLTWVIPDIAAVLNAHDSTNHSLPALFAVVEMTLGARTSATVLGFVVLTMWFCGLSCVTSLSRTFYALSRDRGLPLWPLWARISPKHHTPAPAIWLSVGTSFVLWLYSGAYSVVASICVLGFYLSYLIPIYLGWRLKNQWICKRGPWNLGKASNWINFLALVWSVFICTIMVMPPNTKAGIAIIVVMVVLFAFHRFSGPHEVRKQDWKSSGPNPLAS